MKVIILAAGIGNRIQSHTNSPKCLLKFDGRSLLERHFDLIQRHPVSEVVLVTGYMESLVYKELKKINPKVEVTTAYNEDFRSGSVVSLNVACRHMNDEEAVILMDADVIYHHKIFDTLVSSPYKNLLLLDRQYEDGDEPVKICVKNNKIIEFRKILADGIEYDLVGESVGFFRFEDKMIKNLTRETNKYIESKRWNEPYEEVIRDLVLQFPGDFHYEDITGTPWMEIDFPEDVQKVENVILPAISRKK